MNQASAIEKKIQEIQLLEQQLRSLLMEKQQIQIEQSEAENAFIELKKTTGDVYRVLSGIMMKADKASLLKEVEDKKKLFEARIQSIERKESSVDDDLSVLKKEVQEAMRAKDSSPSIKKN